MPYVLPDSNDLPPLQLRPHHRRSRSSAIFSDEKGSVAHQPLAIPKRRPSKPLFKLDASDDDDDDDEDYDDRPPSPPPSLTVDTNLKDSIPFPSSGQRSPLRSPSPCSPFPRTPSTPIILSNGKPLKPSLKSSSSPNISTLPLHTRSQSAPATPSPQPLPTPKNVHFAEKDRGLESVKLFDKSRKPAAIRLAGLESSGAEETETETEYDSSSFPFPVTPSPVDSGELQLNTELSSTVPTPNPNQYSNVHLETLTFPSVKPSSLRGSVLVRNLAFAKSVAVRFTLDDWQTTSEVTASYVASLPSLPPPFTRPYPTTIGDAIASPPQHADNWDRFSFNIRLEDFERKLAEKTLWLVVRFTADGQGEFWDNNKGSNYRVAFRSGQQTSPTVNSSAQQRTFSAPSTLRSTPMSFSMFPMAINPMNNVPPPPARPSPLRAQSTPSAPSMSSLNMKLSNYASPVTPPITPPRIIKSLPTTTPAAGGGGGTRSGSGSNSNSPSGSGSDSSAPPRIHHRRNHDIPKTIFGGQPATLAWSPPVSSPLPSSPSVDTSDSSYAAFVKQWCFHGSPPPPTPPTSTSTVTTPMPRTENAWLGIESERNRMALAS